MSKKIKPLNLSNLWYEVKNAYWVYVHYGDKHAKQKYDEAYEIYRKAGGTRPRPKHW